MRQVFESCTPRPEVLKGELAEDIFAARLKDVMDGVAAPVYQDPQVFFENTYPTAGLRLLLTEALGRLSGVRPSNSPILRLETAFGGGKTHNLIALYHAARGYASAATMRPIVDSTLLPQPGQVLVAGIVGSDLDANTGTYHSDGDLRTHTLWGELAYQLGRSQGYALAKESDINRSAPGTGLFSELIGQRPTLIMLDELARHMRAAQSVPTATGKSDLAEQTVAFLMSLLEFAASRANVVVVLTLAGSEDAFAKETDHLRLQLAEAHKISARQERVITPTGESEIASIVRHRLFASIDAAAAIEAATACIEAYRRWHDQNVALPSHALSAEYGQALAAAYPFHPELLNALTLRVATIPNFQKTRGALRLLAMVVRRVWEERPADAWFLAPYHVDLRTAAIAEDLTSRLERPAFRQVIDADIVSPKGAAPGHAYQIDGPWVAAGKPRYARRVATTVFLHSLVQGAISGIDPAELLLGTLAPGDEPVLVQKAAERLYDRGWFFEWDGLRYRFKPEPSINKIINDEMQMVGLTAAKAELDGRIRKVWKSGTFRTAYFPQEASDVDDSADMAKLAILHYDAAAVTAVDPAPPELARKIAARAGTQEGYRRYPNALLFLVADADRVPDMVSTTQRYLAITRITNDNERMREFTEDQRKKLKKLGESAELDVRVAITKVYRHLYFPSASASQHDGTLVHELLPAQDQGEVPNDQSEVVLRTLRQQQKALTGNEPMLAAAYVKSRAWDTNLTEMTTDDLRKAFARRLSLPMLFDLNQLKKTILNGIKTQIWVYYDAPGEMGYDHESAPPAVQIGDEAYLYLPDEAERLGLPIKGRTKPPDEPRCPICGHLVSECTCGEEIDGGDGDTRVEQSLIGEGVPQQAFQHLLDLCHDQHIDRLSALHITLQAQGASGAQSLRLLGVAIPQLNARDAGVTLTYAAEFGADEYVTLNLASTWDRYRQLKQVTDELAKAASAFTATLKLNLGFPEGLTPDSDDFRTIHEVLTTMGLGVIRLEAETVAA